MALAQAQAVASSSFQAPDAGIICTFPPCLLLVSQLGTLEPPPLRPNAPLMGIYIYIYIQFIQIGILEAVTTVIVPKLPYRITI